MRSLVLRAADSRGLARALRGSRSAQAVVRRYIAGESVDEAITAAAVLADEGFTVTIDHVGEFVGSMDQAEQAAEVYRQVLTAVGAHRLPAGVSVKPSQFGLLLDPDACASLVADVAGHAASAGVHVTLDMEDLSVTEATVSLVERLRGWGHDNVGCALQAYLHRTPDDLRRLLRLGTSVRLCKGAYAEPAHLAHRRPVDVARAFRAAAVTLLREGHEPRFATHDHRLIAAVQRDAERLDRDRDTFELQLLHGMRPELARALVEDGYRTRIYLPFGREWLPYFSRRLAERPANILLFLRSLAAARTAATPRGSGPRTAPGQRTSEDVPDSRTGVRP